MAVFVCIPITKVPKLLSIIALRSSIY